MIGNEAIHPGTLDLKGDVGTATRLFDLVNIIAEQMISNPKRVKELYDKLPSTKRAAIEKRDGRKQAEMQASVVALSARDRRASAHSPSGR